MGLGKLWNSKIVRHVVAAVLVVIAQALRKQKP
jgi:hypothetical protein